MSRKFKNIFQLILILIILIAMAVTMVFARDDSIAKFQESYKKQVENQSSGNQIPSRPSENEKPGDQSSDSQKPDDVPEKSNNDQNSKDQSSSNSKDEKEDSNNPDSLEKNTYESELEDWQKTDSTSEDSPQTSLREDISIIPVQLQMPEITVPDFEEFLVMSGNNSFLQISYWYYILFLFESFLLASIVVYMFMSRFNKKTFGQTFKNRDKLTIFLLSLIVYTALFTAADVFITRNYLIGEALEREFNELQSQNMQESQQESKDSSSTDGVEIIENSSKTLDSTYETSDSDKSVVLVRNDGQAILKGATINKTGDTTNTEESEFNGLNAALLVEKSKADISDTTFITSAVGANAVFSTGEDSEIAIKDSTITTDKDGSRGLDATYGGKIIANGVNITTQGTSSAAIATDRGQGTVDVSDSELETNGAGSPVIYSTGDITLNNSTGIANGSQICIVEGKNSVYLNNSNLQASAKGKNRETDQAGVMLYQSSSGDPSANTGNFTAKECDLEIQNDSDSFKTAPMFFVTNTSANIELENTKLTFGSEKLISAKGTDEWGKTGENGGNVTFKANNETLEGDIEADDISTVDLDLTSSSLKGKINTDDSAREINIKLDSNSKLELTGDSYITNLENSDSSNKNIILNGYKLYINGEELSDN